MGNLSSHLEKLRNIFPCCRKPPPNHFGDSPLHFAVKDGNEKKVLKLLKKGANVNLPNLDGFTSLHYAVKYGHPNLIKILMEHGGDMSISGFHGLVPFHMLMVARNRLKCLEEIVKHKPDLNAKEVLGNTILQILAMLSPHDTDVLEMLLEHGSNPNSSNIVGNNCLHNIAMLQGCLSAYRTKILATALINKGLNVNATNFAQNTALHFAARTNATLVGILLEEGADINAVNSQGLTAFDVAVKYNVKGVLQHLVKYVVLREHRGQYVKETITDRINSNEQYKKIRVKYEDEMLVLKMSMFSYSPPLSFYDILCSKKKRKQIILDENLMSKLNPENIRYSNYRKELILIFNEGLEARNVAEEAYKIVDYILGDRLPHLCIEKISSFLRAKDYAQLKCFLNE